MKDETLKLEEGQQVIYLAGGCFWGVEKLCSMIPGVVSATSGYANGTVEHPSYEMVKQQLTGARETVRVVYDPKMVNTETILHAYFHVVDPTVTNQQGHDIGTQYQAGLYYTDDKTRRIIEYMCHEEKKKTDVFCIEVCELVNFYDAEEFHQKYLVKNPDGYCHIAPGMMKTAIQTVDSIPDSELYK